MGDIAFSDPDSTHLTLIGGRCTARGRFDALFFGTSRLVSFVWLGVNAHSHEFMYRTLVSVSDSIKHFYHFK